MSNDEFASLAESLVAAGRTLHGNGWVPATSGNLSARLGNGQIAITVSGAHKGGLTHADIMLASADGNPLGEGRPSAETGMHVALYRRFPAVNAVLHAHSPGSILASRLFGDEIVLENHELLKALPGINSHEATVRVPILANDQDIARLASHLDEHLEAHPDTQAFIIAGHGFYAWGTSVARALIHLEALEFMFDLEVRLYGVKKS